MYPIKNLLTWLGIFTIFFYLGSTSKIHSQTADFRVQHIEDDIGNGGGTNTSFTAVSSLNNAFVLANNNRKTHAGNNGAGGNLEGDDLSGARQLTGVGTLTYFREGASKSTNMRFNSSIWEYIGPAAGDNEFIVRGRYAISLNGTNNSDTQAITGITNANDCIPFITGIMNNTTGDDADSGTALAYLENATTLRVQKGSNANNVTVYITLVEFTGSNWTVLHADSGNVSADTGTMTLRDGSDGTGTITNVSAWNEAMIFSHFRADNTTSGTNDAISDLWPVIDPGTNTQTIDWTFNGQHDSGGSNRHFVHVLTNTGLNVTRYQDNSNSTGESTINITSAGLTSINEALIIGSSNSSGGGTAYARGWRNYYLNTTTQAAHWSHRNGNSMSHEIQIVDLSALSSSPEINIQGNATDITDGDITPSLLDDTDFGNVNVTAGTNANTFTIQNTGGTNLNLTDPSPYVTISGTNAADFTLTANPTSPITALNNTTFTITFDPSATGLRTASVSIANDDSDEDPYTFDIQGTGAYCDSNGNNTFDEYIGRVELNTIDNSSGAGITSIGYSDYTGISTTLNANANYTITITPTWTGTIYDEGYSVWIDYNQDGDFADAGEQVWSLAATTASPVSGNFTVPPTATLGNTRMRVSLKYNGIPTECESFAYGEVEDYTINIGPVALPEINIQGNATDIADGDITPSLVDDTDYGTINVGIPISKTFTIQNTGTANLTISSITLSNATDFSIVGTPYASPVAASGSTTFTVQFNALTLGTKSSTVTVNNNDSDEASYQFDIQATAEQNFFDSDGDGVYDNIDIDDDNDGILDSEEELACQISSTASVMNYKFLNETFGTGNTRTTINTTYNATTTYCYEDGAGSGCVGGNDLNDGEYTVYDRIADGDGNNDTPTDDIGSWADAYWYTGEDHTPGDTNGRMAIFNASNDPGVFYTATITGALPNVPITYSFWVLNLDTQAAPGIASRLRPDILVEFRDVNNNVLASISTGDIPPSINGDAANSWHEFTANLTLNVSEFYVYFINNETGGLGNDLAIDDIVIAQTLCDSDNDGVADVFDLDSDNDGIPDVVEAGLGNYSEGSATLTGVTNWVDANGNGMHDLAEGNIVLDSDGDGVPNYLDLDSDNDTIFDVDESGAGNTANPLYQNGDGDITGDGVGDGTDTDTIRETDIDSDGILEYFTDGILDLYDYHNGVTFAAAYGNTNQGLGNTYYVLDSDSDGLPDYMDVTSDGGTYDISHTLYASLDANNDGVIDDINDTDGDGILDLYDTDDALFGSPRDLNRKLDLYFDGRNDYAEDINVINGWGNATIMTWIKIDPSAAGTQIIAGQDEFYLQLNADKSVSTIANGYSTTNGSALNTDQWIHITATYSNTNSILRLYINGFETSNIAVSGGLPADTSNFTIGREPNTDDKYFHGYIDELRIFDKALSSDELRKMIYQEIENNGGVARGSIIPKDITDFIDESNNTPLNWSNLVRYFRMDTYKDDIIDDLSTAAVDIGSGAKIYNTKIIGTQTAPLPFVTQTTGNLDVAVDVPTEGVNGNDVSTYDWSIVQIEHNNIAFSNSHKHLGLIVNELDSSLNPIELSVQNDSELNISWYLKLDGLIDLEGESQLVQGPDSTLDVTSKGAIERDQQGTADLYTYNYWAAPVGVTSTVSNNNSYTLADVLQDGTTAATPLTINWITSGYNGTSGSPVGIADYWIWKYANQPSDDYPSWQHVRSTNALQPGEGYTMKGTTDTGGTITTEQNYVFNGKPHNGDVTLTLSAGNDYLVGNPYASAIDANEFILDNVSDGAGRAASNIIDGTLYFWEHFASSTHILREYQGGYGTYTLIGGIAAINNDTRINYSGGLTTSKGAPEQYIPVGQGFFVTADDGGTITFKNSQRTFRTEASDPSVFMRAAGSKKEKINNSSHRIGNNDTRQKIRLMFDSPKGYHRQLLVGVDSSATDSQDIGFDAPLIEDNVEDMYWSFDNNKFVIQGVSNFNADRVLPLAVKIDQEGNGIIRIDDLENIADDTNIYLHDKELEIYHDLRESNYETFLTAGEHLNRFEITFANGEALNNPEKMLSHIDIHYSNNINSVILINPKSQMIRNIKMTNMLGQLVYEHIDDISDNYKEIKVRNLNSGAYLITVSTNKGNLTKKVVIE